MRYIRSKLRHWTWKQFYTLVIRTEYKMARTGNVFLANKCIELENLMNYLKAELTEGNNLPEEDE